MDLVLVALPFAILAVSLRVLPGRSSRQHISRNCVRLADEDADFLR